MAEAKRLPGLVLEQTSQLTEHGNEGDTLYFKGCTSTISNEGECWDVTVRQ